MARKGSVWIRLRAAQRPDTHNMVNRPVTKARGEDWHQMNKDYWPPVSKVSFFTMLLLIIIGKPLLVKRLYRKNTGTLKIRGEARLLDDPFACLLDQLIDHRLEIVRALICC